MSQSVGQNGGRLQGEVDFELCWPGFQMRAKTWPKPRQREREERLEHCSCDPPGTQDASRGQEGYTC